MSKPFVLVLEDESDVRATVVGCLRSLGLEVLEAATPVEARRYSESRTPHVAVVSATLARGGACDIVRELRERAPPADVGILMLAHRSMLSEARASREYNADTLVGKPISPQELTSRVEDLLIRHQPQLEAPEIAYGGLSFSRRHGTIRRSGATASVGPTEGRILALLLAHPERVYTRTQLLGLLWSSRVRVEPRTVDVHVRRLRGALASVGAAEMLQTVRGVGYRLSSVLM
jgi:two-component system phosphate regulon response regulator PhoB